MENDDLDQRLSALRDAPLPAPLAPASLVRARGDRRRQRARAVNATAVVALVAGAAIASASLLGEGRGTDPSDIARPDATLSRSADPDPPSTFLPSPDIPADGTDFGFIVEIRETPEGLVLFYNKADLLTGEAARAAKVADGVDPDEPPDYYISDQNPALRQALLADEVEVLGSTNLEGAAAEGQPSSLDRLREVIRTDQKIPFDLSFDSRSRVVRVAERYLP